MRSLLLIGPLSRFGVGAVEVSPTLFSGEDACGSVALASSSAVWERSAIR
jgi:hypothetical protein